MAGLQRRLSLAVPPTQRPAVQPRFHTQSQDVLANMQQYATNAAGYDRPGIFTGDLRSMAGVFGSGLAAGSHPDEYLTEDKYRAYQMRAALVPETAQLIPSYYGRLPLPLVPVRLTASGTVTIPASQQATLLFLKNAFFPPATAPHNFTKTTYPIMAAYIVDAVGTNNGSEGGGATWSGKIKSICSTTAIEDVVPMSPYLTTGGYSYYRSHHSGGLVKMEVVKASALDEDPIMSYTGACNMSSEFQQNSDTSGDAELGVAKHSHPRLQSVLGMGSTQSHGNEFTNIPKEKSSHFVAVLPPVIDWQGRMMPVGPQTPTGDSWAGLMADGKSYDATGVGGVTAYVDATIRLLTVKNSSATNAITLNFNISHNYFVLPSEQYAASNPNACVREVRYRLPAELLTVTSSGAIGDTTRLAHIAAVHKTSGHRHAQQKTHQASIASALSSVNTTHSAAPPAAPNPDADHVGRAVGHIAKAGKSLAKSGLESLATMAIEAIPGLLATLFA